jgi:predicted RNase H-like HicB family nuclease
MSRYAIVVENAGSNLAAYVPDLPGCIATGESQEEVGRLIREAIKLHLEGLEKDGLPIPEPSSRVEYIEVNASACVVADLAHRVGVFKTPHCPASVGTGSRRGY